MIGKEEFTKGSLARFDRADLNKDEVLTGDERRNAGLGRDPDNQDAPANTSGRYRQLKRLFVENGTGPLPHPATQSGYSMGGRVGERAGAVPIQHS